MVPAEVLAVAEGLLEFDPLDSYGVRAASLVARAVGARGVKLERIDEPDALHGLVASSMPSQTYPLRHGRGNIGSLHLYFDAPTAVMDTEARRNLRWLLKQLVRGITYAERLKKESSERPASSFGSALEYKGLTPRERDVVALLVTGSSTRLIASQVGLAESTVNTYLKRAFAKLGVHSRVELVARLASTEDSEAPARTRRPD